MSLPTRSQTVESARIHVWPAHADDPEHADELRIDLDPQPGTHFDVSSAGLSNSSAKMSFQLPGTPVGAMADGAGLVTGGGVVAGGGVVVAGGCVATSAAIWASVNPTLIDAPVLSLVMDP